MERRSYIHSFTTHQHVQRKLTYVKGKNTSHTSHSLHSHAREMQRVPRSQTRIRVAIPRVNPGSEPVQPPRLAGVWTVADTHTGMAWHGLVWYGLGLRLKVSSRSEGIIHKTPTRSQRASAACFLHEPRPNDAQDLTSQTPILTTHQYSRPNTVKFTP